MIVAHAGHWVATLPFFGPVLAVGGGVAAMALRDRRQRRRPGGPGALSSRG